MIQMKEKLNNTNKNYKDGKSRQNTNFTTADHNPLSTGGPMDEKSYMNEGVFVNASMKW